MAIWRVEYKVYLGTGAQATGVYDYMRGLADQSRAINPYLPTEERGRSWLDEPVGGALVRRRSYQVTPSEIVDDPNTDLAGAGVFLVGGMMAFADQGYAQNASNQAEALAQQGAAILTGSAMAELPDIGFPRESTGSVHDCKHEAGERCVTLTSWRVALPEPAVGIEWTVGEAVVVGDIRTYNGVAYVCLQAHTTQAGWTPPVVPALWNPVP